MTIRLDPALTFQDPRLGRLLDWWCEKVASLDRLPGRQHFDPLEMAALLPHLYMADVVAGGARYRWRLLGTELNALAGRDVTGRHFDEIYAPDIYDNVVASLAAVVRDRQPMRSYGTYAFAARAFVGFEAMEVPLASDGKTVDIILGIAIGMSALP